MLVSFWPIQAAWRINALSTYVIIASGDDLSHIRRKEPITLTNDDLLLMPPRYKL